MGFVAPTTEPTTMRGGRRARPAAGKQCGTKRKDISGRTRRDIQISRANKAGGRLPLRGSLRFGYNVNHLFTKRGRYFYPHRGQEIQQSCRKSGRSEYYSLNFIIFNVEESHFNSLNVDLK